MTDNPFVATSQDAMRHLLKAIEQKDLPEMEYYSKLFQSVLVCAGGHLDYHWQPELRKLIDALVMVTQYANSKGQIPL